MYNTFGSSSNAAWIPLPWVASEVFRQKWVRNGNNRGSGRHTVMNIPRGFTGDMRSEHISSLRRVNPVNPPIENQNLSDRRLLQNNLCCNSYVVEETEAHGFLRLRVMTGGANDCHRSFAPPVCNGHCSFDGGPATESNRGRSFVVDEQ